MLPESSKTTRYMIPVSPNHCSHRYAGIDAVVVRQPEEGFTAKYLLCEIVGPKRSNTQAARRALTEMQARDEDELFPAATELNF
jgi:hypothetical protein